MIRKKKEFSLGLVMLAGFFVVLALIFMPLFEGKNGLEYLDNLFNSIAKGSAYYVPKVREDIREMGPSRVELALALDSAAQAEKASRLFMRAGALVNVQGDKLTVSGELGAMIAAALEDADAMYRNEGAAVSGRAGFPEREVLYTWYRAFKAAEKALQGEKKFKEARVIAQLNQKAIEPAYNFYGVEAQRILDRAGVVVFSLVFYVVYTLWYGFAILFLFEGWGMQLEH